MLDKVAKGNTCLVLVSCLVLVLTGQNCEARRDILGDIFSFMEFDARTVTHPVAVAVKSPSIPVPQYRPSNPIFIPPKNAPQPEIMINGITPYSSLPNPHLSHSIQQSLLLSSLYPPQNSVYK